MEGGVDARGVKTMIQSTKILEQRTKIQDPRSRKTPSSRRQLRSDHQSSMPTEGQRPPCRGWNGARLCRPRPARLDSRALRLVCDTAALQFSAEIDRRFRSDAHDGLRLEFGSWSFSECWILKQSTKHQDPRSRETPSSKHQAGFDHDEGAVATQGQRSPWCGSNEPRMCRRPPAALATSRALRLVENDTAALPCWLAVGRRFQIDHDGLDLEFGSWSFSGVWILDLGSSDQ
jgi:hypothetical protein